MRKILPALWLITASPALWAIEVPSECQTFLAEAEKMFQLVELDEKVWRAEIVRYQREMENIDPIKLPRMCSEATDAIQEQLPDLEKQAAELKALKQKK